jgi:hypothetical protein
MVQSMHGFFSSDTHLMKDREVPHQEATSVAEEVCAFYEDYPYPPPVNSLEKYQVWQDPQKQRAEHHLLWPSRSFGQDQSILIAGCGTSQAAKHAMRWPAAIESCLNNVLYCGQEVRYATCWKSTGTGTSSPARVGVAQGWVVAA